jgi:hypothetical protein
MKHRLIALFLTAASCLSCQEWTEISTPSSQEIEIELSAMELTLKTGMTASLTARIHPWNAAETAIEWASSDPAVASVDQNGTVTALTIGEAEISATCGNVRQSCKLTVVTSTIYTTEIRFNYTTISLKEGEAKTLQAFLTPYNSTEGTTWSTEDPSIATVDETGKITGVKSGITTITVTSGSQSESRALLVHGDLWLKQTDALIKPVSFEEFDWDPDTIRVARGEAATVQFIVKAQTHQGQVIPSVEYFASKGQTSGVAVEPSFYWLPDIKCSNKWDSWAGGMAPDRYPNNELYFPDPQMPASEYQVSLNQGEKMPLWVEFDIPRDMPAGIYEGAVSISGSEKATAPFVVQVYDVTLPEQQTMTALQWLNYSELDAMASSPGSVHMNANYERLENIIIPLLSRYGTNGFRTFYSKAGDANIHFIKSSSGELIPQGTFNSLKRDIELMLRACPQLHYVQGQNLIASVADKTTTGELTILGYKLNDDGSIKLTDNGDGTFSPEFKYVTQGSAHSPEGEAYISNYAKALQEFLRSQNLPDGRTWLDIYLQTICDEPVDVTVPAYERISSYVRKGGPDLTIMEPLTTGKIGHEYIDIPCPVTSMLDFNQQNIFCKDQPFVYGPEQTKWSYTCVQPQGNGLNRFIRVPLFKTRYLHWLSFLYDNVGYLHWGANYWVGSPDGDPWKDAAGSYIGGDMFIIWPGPETVYPSIRLSAMRDGLRDYDLLKMVAQVSEADAKAFCRRIVWNSDQYETDIEAFRQVRKEILEYLSR